MPRDETRAWSSPTGRQSSCSSRGVEERTKWSQCGGRQGGELKGQQANGRLTEGPRLTAGV
jgi:hypothetical protein